MPDARHEGADEEDPLVGQVIDGRFTLLSRLAAGGTGLVYRAVQAPLDRVVAVKLLAPGSAGASDPAAVKRFFLEAQVSSRISHPGAVAVHDSGRTTDGAFYLVMELAEGPTLADVLRHGPLPTERAVEIGIALCEVLGSAHALGIVHCDVKPGNVVLPDAGGVKLLDFGAARFADPSLASSQSGTGAGSPLYMSPEQTRGERPDPRTDVYALGLVLYEMVAGRPPFAGASALDTMLAHVQESPKPPRLLNPAVPLGLQAVILRCLEKDRARRFSSVGDLAMALQAAAAGDIHADRAPGLRRWLIAAVMLVLAAAALGGALVVRRLLP